MLKLHIENLLLKHHKKEQILILRDKEMKVQLGDVCERYSSNVAQKDITEVKNGYPIYGATGIVGNIGKFQQDSKYVAVVKDGAGIGRAMLLPAKSSIIGTLQGLIPNNKILPEYLFFAVQHMALKKYYSGSTIPHIYFRNYKNEILNLPNMIEQEKVINSLQIVEKFIKNRENVINELTSLEQARFVEMFGSYPINPKVWDIVRIRDVVKEVKYGTSRPATQAGKYPYLRMNNITYNGELELSDIKYIDVPKTELSNCTVQYGDVLFNRTNSKELVGKTCVYNQNNMMVLAGFIIRIRVNERVLPQFLSTYLNTDFSKKMLAAMCKTAIGQANINAQELQNICIYVPPIKLQEEFVKFKKQIDKSKLREEKRQNILLGK